MTDKLETYPTTRTLVLGIASESERGGGESLQPAELFQIALSGKITKSALFVADTLGKLVALGQMKSTGPLLEGILQASQEIGPPNHPPDNRAEPPSGGRDVFAV